MLPVSIKDFALVLALAGKGQIFSPHAPTLHQIVELLLRWIHYIAGITWIGLLYFFNFVNGSFMKSLDGPTKDKVTPQLMPRALWWFRWGAFVTVLAGLGIFGLYLRADQGTWMLLGRWAAIVLVTYVVIYGIQRVNWGPGKGWGLAAAVTVIVSVMAVVMLVWSSGGDPTDMSKGLFSQDAHSLSISIGGGLGTIMFLNVWGIIWPIQKRLIAWTIDKADKGTAPPSEAAALGRRAFLASRMNTWLSIPMLLFMAAGSHGYFFGR